MKWTVEVEDATELALKGFYLDAEKANKAIEGLLDMLWPRRKKGTEAQTVNPKSRGGKR
jgi:hypothetical protein